MEEIAEKFFYHKDWNKTLYSSAYRSIQKIGGAELIDEKKYPDNIIKIDGSDWKNKEYIVIKKGKKLIDEIKEIWGI